MKKMNVRNLPVLVAVMLSGVSWAWETSDAMPVHHDSTMLSQNLATPITRMVRSDPCPSSMDALCDPQLFPDSGQNISTTPPSSAPTTSPTETVSMAPTPDDPSIAVVTVAPVEEKFPGIGRLPVYAYVLIGCGVLIILVVALTMARRGARRDFHDVMMDFNSISSYSTESSQPTAV